VIIYYAILKSFTIVYNNMPKGFGISVVVSISYINNHPMLTVVLVSYLESRC